MLETQSRMATWYKDTSYTVRENTQRNMAVYEQLKRVLDVMLAGMLLVVLSPLLLVIVDRMRRAQVAHQVGVTDPFSLYRTMVGFENAPFPL